MFRYKRTLFNEKSPKQLEVKRSGLSSDKKNSKSFNLNTAQKKKHYKWDAKELKNGSNQNFNKSASIK